MINLKMIADGYAAGIIKIIDSPHEDGAVCQIGDIWFYFGGEEAESSSAEEYKKNVPDADIINEIFSALEDFKTSGDEFLLEAEIERLKHILELYALQYGTVVETSTT